MMQQQVGARKKGEGPKKKRGCEPGHGARDGLPCLDVLRSLRCLLASYDNSDRIKVGRAVTPVPFAFEAIINRADARDQFVGSRLTDSEIEGAFTSRRCGCCLFPVVCQVVPL